MYLGFMLTVVAFAQLICPVAGQLSDRCRSKWGKRRPYILFGTLVACVSIAGLWSSSQLRIPMLFFSCLFFSQCALNIISSAQASIVPDNFTQDKGTVSGVVSCLQLTGNFSGMIWIIMTWNMDYHYAYGTHLVLLSLAAIIVCQIQERPTDGDPENAITWETIAQSFLIDLEGDRDFFLVFVGRTLFYMSMSCQTFLYYYFRDMMQVEDEGLVRYRMAVLCLISTFIGMCSSFPLGKASDHPKIGRKSLIYFACITMACVYIAYCLVPAFIGPTRIGLYTVYAMGGVYGLGFAGYLSVDYALALDCMPEKQKGSSEALGLWGIAGFAGSMLGPLLGGFILQMHSLPEGGYSYQGWVMMLSTGVVCFLLSAVVTSFIKKVN